VTDPLNNTTSNQYDTHGNLLSRTSPAPDGNTPGSTTRFTYDSSGQLLTITDPLNNQTTMTYYPTGLLHTITDQQQNTTSYEYDARGNRTRVTDAAQNQTQFQYDSMNRLTIVTYPDQSTAQFGYDHRGRRTSVTDQNQKTTTYAYDDADRLISVTDAQTPNPGVTRYTYDTENDVTDIYDAANNHTHVDYNTANGFPLKTTFPSGFTESYGWWGGDEHLLNSKTDRNGKAITYTYDFERRISYRKYPDGTNARFDYDAPGRLIKVTDPTGTYQFSYDGMSHLTQTTTNYTFLPSRTFTVKYGYDPASNRVTTTDPRKRHKSLLLRHSEPAKQRKRFPVA
jgi:YD repeat-containing protein